VSAAASSTQHGRGHPTLPPVVGIDLVDRHGNVFGPLGQNILQQLRHAGDEARLLLAGARWA
jgi:hypothetical protein